MIPSAPFRRIACTLLVASLFAAPPVKAETADEAWQRIGELQLKAKADAPKGTNEVEFYAPLETDLHDAAAGFAKAHAEDPRHWDAELLALKYQQFPASADQRRAIFEHNETVLKTILAAPDAPSKVKQDAERTVLRQHLDHLDLIASSEQATALEARLADYLRRFPEDPKAANMQVRRIDLWQRANPARAAALRDEMATSSDPKIATAAQGRQAQQALGNVPLDWKLPALDGTSIDFASLRGKVVLVQFWASWCPDCAREMPTVLDMYRRFHGGGLEIVGVSLDRDKDALLATVKKKGITWPQFYDAKGWDNELAVRYGVRGIPELWLVDASGKVVATGVQVDQLASMIPPLLPAR